MHACMGTQSAIYPWNKRYRFAMNIFRMGRECLLKLTLAALSTIHRNIQVGIPCISLA